MLNLATDERDNVIDDRNRLRAKIAEYEELAQENKNISAMSEEGT